MRKSRQRYVPAPVVLAPAPFTELGSSGVVESTTFLHEVAGGPAVDYALRFGRDLDRGLADRFVGMYVNHWTLDYGPRGRAAIDRLLKDGTAAGLVPDVGEIEYVTAR